MRIFILLIPALFGLFNFSAGNHIFYEIIRLCLHKNKKNEGYYKGERTTDPVM